MGERCLRLFAAVGGPRGFDFDGAGFAGGDVVEAGPWPVLRFVYQAALDGIAVHVTQLLGGLLSAPDVEVVVTRLPEAPSFGVLEFARGLLFEDLDGFGERFGARLADEEVDMLRHEDVPGDDELIADADGFEFVLEEGVGGGGVE